VARCGVLFALSPLGSAVVAGIGALTALFAATIALKQWDIKRVLAYSTVSQLGYMFVGVGTGAYAAGVFHLVTHAFFKALLFLGSGSVIHAIHHAYHATHTHEDAQDMRNMGGLARHMPWTAALMWVATLAIAGIPPFAGFFSKDEILGAAFAEATVRPLWYAFWAMGLAAALLTAFYMTRLMLYTFHGPNRTGEREREHLHEAPPVMTGPLVVLGVLTVLGGALNVPELFGGKAFLEHWLEPGDQRRAPPPARARGRHDDGMDPGGGRGPGRRAGDGRRVPPPQAGGTRSRAARATRNGARADPLEEVVRGRAVRCDHRAAGAVALARGALEDRRCPHRGRLLVNGTAAASRAVGWLGSRLQTGQVGVYVVLFVIGVLAVVRAVVR